MPLDLADLPSATKIPAREPVGTCRSDAQVIRVNCCGGCHAAFALAETYFRHSDLNPRREGSDIGIMTPSPTTNLASCDCAPLSRDYAALAADISFRDFVASETTLRCFGRNSFSGFRCKRSQLSGNT